MKQSLLVALLGIAGFLAVAAWGATSYPAETLVPYFTGVAIGLAIGGLSVLACVIHGEG